MSGASVIRSSLWSRDGLTRLARSLETGGSTAMMIFDDHDLVFQWGDVALTTSVASVRKSLINVLFGIYVDRGAINLDASLRDLDIDDVDTLTQQERSATVLDLLKARSGVYHPSVYDTHNDRPPRGSHPPGTFWFYNNWDFNVLGSIFEHQTGQNLFDAFEESVARPLGMQDFRTADCFYHDGPQSRHPVYKMRMSARDLARIGTLYLGKGKWNGQRIVSQDWVRASLQPHSDLGGGRGYGYMWWTATENATSDSLAVDVPLFYASGFGGQYVIVLPARDLVVVHRCARVDHGVNHARMGEILRLALSARAG